MTPPKYYQSYFSEIRIPFLPRSSQNCPTTSLAEWTTAQHQQFPRVRVGYLGQLQAQYFLAENIALIDLNQGYSCLEIT